MMENYKALAKKLGALFLFITFAVSVASCNTEDKNQGDGLGALSTLIVSYIDVGQGDSILLECNDEAMLIDAGENDKGDVVLDYLNVRNIDRLKYAVGTHPHSDHIGGMDTVMQEVPADSFIYPSCDYETKTWNDVLDVAACNKSKLIKASLGNSYSLGDATFTIYAPQTDSIYSDCNNYSVVIRLTYGDTSFLFTGDAEAVSEKEMIKMGYCLKSDVLKVGHHGSRYSSCEQFLDAVDPKYAVISCGKDNEYGHPHSEVIKKLNDRNIAVFRTDQKGTVVLTSDGENIDVAKGTEYSYNGEKSEYTLVTSGEKTVYIGNKNSLIFHKSSCHSVKAMNDENMVYFDNRKAAVASGYHSCGSCKP